MKKYCIKKNPESTGNPYLLNLNGVLCYGSLDMALRKRDVSLETFDSYENTRSFIQNNPSLCDARTIVCEVNVSVDSISISPYAAKAA